jgi:hypothetical protein
MSEVNTVMHEGSVYEIGKDYLFSLNELDWTYAKLTDIDGGYEKVFCTQSYEWRYIREIPASRTMGTITPAPIEPTMAELFVFDIRDISLCGDVKTADQMIAKGWVKK